MANFDDARRTMVETQLLTRTVTDKRVLQVMSNVAREKFVPQDRVGLAYSDVEHDLHAANGRILPSAAPFARLLQLANIMPTDVVLDVACGSGYSTAVIAGLASAVVGVEDDKALADEADARISDLEIGNAAIVSAPLQRGVASEAPFDVIIIEGVVDRVPQNLLDQLSEHGRLVTYVAAGRTGIATLFVRSGKDVTSRQDFDANMPKLHAFDKSAEFSL